MKNKIENLIEEVGINEVDSILQEMKSKVNVKENIKKDFIDLLTGCNISFLGDDIYYKKDGKLFCYYRKNNNNFRIIYEIWLKLQSKYNLNHQELRNLLVGIVEEVFNYKGVTFRVGLLQPFIQVEEVFNYKGVTLRKFNDCASI